MSDKMLEEHNSWFKREYPFTWRDKEEDEESAVMYFAHSEIAWVASRASLVVELPKPCRTQFENYFEWAAARDFVDECRLAIQAAGVTVKCQA